MLGPVDDASLRYVPLGDSYTIGTSVRREERWPDQLVARLAEGATPAVRRPALELVGNPAVNGFTTRDVIAFELPLLVRLRPEVVSLLIGTNDVLQGVDESEYRRNLATILDSSQRWAGHRVFGLTSPDYTVTPAGPDYGDPVVRSAELRRRNALFAEVLADRGLAVVDIHDISLEAAADRSLVAYDGLHPSGRQYARWVDRLEPIVRSLLGA
jgi:lysophospholipase L1-like esterase